MKLILRNYFVLILIALFIGLFGKMASASGKSSSPAPQMGEWVGLSANTSLDSNWQHLGSADQALQDGWRQQFGNTEGMSQLQQVNDWANDQIKYRADSGDTWSSVGQTLSRGYGDCEDIAIVKYNILKSLGFSEDQLFLVVARDLVARNDHAILLINSQEGQIVLDNFTSNVFTTESLEGVMRPIAAYSGRQSWIFGKRRRK